MPTNGFFRVGLEMVLWKIMSWLYLVVGCFYHPSVVVGDNPKPIIEKTRGEISSKREYFLRIDKIKWFKYDTAFGNAQSIVPRALKAIASGKPKAVFKASACLESSICHQWIMASPVSLPAYDFLMWAFKEYDQQVIDFSPPGQLGDMEMMILDLLDIFAGLASTCKGPNQRWREEALHDNLLRDQSLFIRYREHPNEEMARFANIIFENLTK